MTTRAVKMAGWSLVLVLFAVAGLLLLRDYHQLRAASLLSRIGKNAPDVAVVGMDGASLRLAAFRGHPLWLNFFATWCPPCKSEMPEIERHYRRYYEDGLDVVGIDQQETPTLIKRFAKPLAITFPLVIDNGPAAESYRVFALPTSVFVDAQGVIRAVHTGAMTSQQMDADVARILKNKAE